MRASTPFFLALCLISATGCAARTYQSASPDTSGTTAPATTVASTKVGPVIPAATRATGAPAWCSDYDSMNTGGAGNGMVNYWWCPLPYSVPR